jgi:hypothetical protein
MEAPCIAAKAATASVQVGGILNAYLAIPYRWFLVQRSGLQSYGVGRSGRPTVEIQTGSYLLDPVDFCYLLKTMGGNCRRGAASDRVAR